MDIPGRCVALLAIIVAKNVAEGSGGQRIRTEITCRARARLNVSLSIGTVCTINSVQIFSINIIDFTLREGLLSPGVELAVSVGICKEKGCPNYITHFTIL